MSRARVTTIVWAAWVLLALLFATQAFIGSHYASHPLSWGQALSLAALAWGIRGIVAFGVFRLAHIAPFRRGDLLKAFAVHIPTSVVVAIVEQGVISNLAPHVPGLASAPVSPVEAHMSLFVYWLIVGAAHAQRFYLQSERNQIAAAKLDAQLNAARLDLLRARLQPHFLFNTLNDIAELMHEDTERADLMLTHLAELIRHSLRDRTSANITLGEEVAFLDRYLDLARMRFQERLSVRMNIPEDLKHAMVPNLLLQPLVENAIRHGVARRNGGDVSVDARRDGSTLHLEVRDNGPGLGAREPSEGIGLRTTRERLTAQFGERCTLELRDLAGGGVCAAINLPLQSV
jgi:signal transduction histidine kinase